MVEVAEASEATQEVPVSTSFIGEDGNFTDGWMEKAGIAEDLRGDQTLMATKNVAGMASQLVNAQKMIGKNANMVVIPTEKSTQAEWDDFYRETGRPDTPDDYGITHQEAVGDVDADLEGAFKALAHSEGLRPSTVQKLIDLDDSRVMAIQQAAEQAKVAEAEAAEQASKEQWGAAYEERLRLANRMVEENTSEETKQQVLNEIGNSPIVADFLANIAKKFVEHKVISADVSQPTPVEALAHAEELRNTPGYINGELFKTSPSTHARITAEISDIMKKAYPSKG